MIGREITVQGRVQGVGFRPYVWRLARDAGLKGHVFNDVTGVTIAAWGTQAALDKFQQNLIQSPPPLAQVDSVTATGLTGPPDSHGFHIIQSRSGPVATQITPDAATCAACLAEINDLNDRRYRYPFTNCTHCGPRLSIVQGVPYDRAQTSMAKFKMCADCQREYEDPNDRRFHAQPNACPICGPRIWVEDATGKIDCQDPLTETVARLQQGQIIAIKGIGGFHLACDATNAATVALLRKRKNRIAKPFAIMAENAAQIETVCHLSDAEAALVNTPTAPIVLLQKRKHIDLHGIAPSLDRIGIMLPHTPLHHLLMAQVDGPLVMTSGNPSNTPQVTENHHARKALAAIADAWLMHDRDIMNRLDDSVMRLDAQGPTILRRSRGMAPAPVPLHDDFAETRPTLAMGATLKSTFCLLKNGQAIPSQHIGDLTTADTYADYRAKIALFRELYDFTPEVIAIDQHPDYLSTRWGEKLAHDMNAKLVRVQHHHAHMISCLAEHRVAPDDALSVGVILDGTGLGQDGTIWGGEILLGDYAGFTREAHLQPVALPGGDQAAFEPWRNLVAHLMAAFGESWEQQIAGSSIASMLADKPTALIAQMITQNLNVPLSSSAGRLFDAVAAAMGVGPERQQYEGQAAMELQALIGDRTTLAGYPATVSDGGVISWAPLWTALLADLHSSVDYGDIAMRFHVGLADVLVKTAVKVADQAGTNRIILSGGVMQNSVLHDQLTRGLNAQGYNVLSPKNLPANDGGIALGQACSAAWQAGY